MEPVLRIGLAGLGSVSRQIPAAFEATPGAKLTAVTDIRPEALDRWSQQYGVETYTSVEQMCESPNVDAVWVCTPNQLHAEHAILAAEHRKHVICEKPMAVTLDEAQSIVDAVANNGVTYVQGHSKIFDPPVRKMREIVSNGTLGQLIQVNNWEYKPWLSQPRLETEVEGEIGGGVLYRQGPHQTDVVRGVGGGMVRSVRAIAGRHHPAFPNAEGDYTAFLEFEDGTAATMVFNGYGYFDITEMTWGIGEGGQQQDPLQKKVSRATGAVDTTAKYAYADARAVKEQAERSNRRFQPFYGLTLASCERGDLRQSPDGLYMYTDDGREEITFERKHGRGELDELCDAVRQDRPSFPDARWGMATLEVILAVRQSSQERREIMLSRQVPCPF